MAADKNIHIHRVPNRGVAANVKHVVYHSPDGFEFGYGGSGPSDLALSIIEHVLKSEGYKGPRDKRAFLLSYGLHQGFKWGVIARIPFEYTEYTIEYDFVVDWIARNVPDWRSHTPDSGEE